MIVRIHEISEREVGVAGDALGIEIDDEHKSARYETSKTCELCIENNDLYARSYFTISAKELPANIKVGDKFKVFFERQ